MLNVSGPTPIGHNFLGCTLSFLLLFSHLSFFDLVLVALFEVSEYCFSEVNAEITLYVATQSTALILFCFFCDSEFRLLHRSLTRSTHSICVISKSDDVVKVKVVLTAFHCHIVVK